MKLKHRVKEKKEQKTFPREQKRFLEEFEKRQLLIEKIVSDNPRKTKKISRRIWQRQLTKNSKRNCDCKKRAKILKEQKKKNLRKKIGKKRIKIKNTILKRLMEETEKQRTIVEK